MHSNSLISKGQMSRSQRDVKFQQWKHYKSEKDKIGLREFELSEC